MSGALLMMTGHCVLTRHAVLWHTAMRETTCHAACQVPVPMRLKLNNAILFAVPPDAITLATEPIPSAPPVGGPAAAAPPPPAAPAAVGPPKARSLADDILGDLYSLQPAAPAGEGGGAGG